MTYPEAIDKAEKIDSNLRYIVKPNTPTASSMVLKDMNAFSMYHLLEEKGEQALDDFIERLKKKNEKIRKEYLNWYFKQTDQDDFINIRIFPNSIVKVRLTHEPHYGISWASIDKKIVAFFHYTGTKTTTYHYNNLKREASYQLGLKVYHYLEDA